jgi:hypothetical protein
LHFECLQAYGIYRGEEKCMQGFEGGESEAKRPFGKPRHASEDNIKMDLKFNWRMWTAFIWLQIGPTDGHL